MDCIGDLDLASQDVLIDVVRELEKQLWMLRASLLRRFQWRQQTMEPLWSPVVATSGNRSQITRAGNPRKQAKTVAMGCDRLPIPAMVTR
jgi:hypothetical protein